MKSVYVYYRIDPTRLEPAAARLKVLLDLMAAHCSQPPRRLSRCDDAEMWMEVYEGITDSDVFLAAMNVAVARLQYTDFILGERHLECFAEAAA